MTAADDPDAKGTVTFAAAAADATTIRVTGGNRTAVAGWKYDPAVAVLATAKGGGGAIYLGMTIVDAENDSAWSAAVPGVPNGEFDVWAVMSVYNVTNPADRQDICSKVMTLTVNTDPAASVKAAYGTIAYGGGQPQRFTAYIKASGSYNAAASYKRDGYPAVYTVPTDGGLFRKQVTAVTDVAPDRPTTGTWGTQEIYCPSVLTYNVLVILGFRPSDGNGPSGPSASGWVKNK